MESCGEGFAKALERRNRRFGAASSSLGRNILLGPPRCRALRQQCAGVLPPAWEITVPKCSYLPFPSLYDQPAGVRVGRRGFESPPLGDLLDSFFALFRVVFAFWAHLKSSWHFFTMFFDLFRFSIDFGWIWGGFWEGFGRIFRCFFDFFLKLPIL